MKMAQSMVLRLEDVLMCLVQKRQACCRQELRCFGGYFSADTLTAHITHGTVEHSQDKAHGHWLMRK